MTSVIHSFYKSHERRSPLSPNLFRQDESHVYIILVGKRFNRLHNSKLSRFTTLPTKDPYGNSIVEQDNVLSRMTKCTGGNNSTKENVDCKLFPINHSKSCTFISKTNIQSNIKLTVV